MISDAELQFYKKLREDIEQHPDWLSSAMEATHQGLQYRLAKESERRNEWEIIAMNAMEARLFNTNKDWLSRKIEALKDTASFRWDHIIERMKK